jgi:hypothetical protein
MLASCEKAVQSYLASLRRKLDSVSPAVRNAAIADAEEFLRSELHRVSPDASTVEISRHFDETYGSPGQIAAEYSQLEGRGEAIVFRKCRCVSTKWIAAAATLMLLGLATVGVCYAAIVEPPKISPFTRVDFVADKVLVIYEGKAWELLAIDGISIDKIVESAKTQFGPLWQKRIAEDVVEVLWGMKHHPAEAVELRLRDPKTSQLETIATARMTEANRQRLYLARHPELLRELAGEQPPKLSPFTRVTYKGEQVFVQYDGNRYEWLALDGQPVERIVASAKQQFDQRWQKRVAEDLVEVLWGMDQKPGDTVKLRLRDPESHKEVHVEEAPMTHENRRAVWGARNGVELSPERP